ncbi:hypothetical protein RN001_008587 [Aquatica leii]|uniref:Methyltransferase domain-containing protein n=1 Tax=Aquatica leii TaxID=1421715 RepID=A0AAN7S9R5_9COLE|nr:hypothetical protein RN001_008587 [Aquatica leii]
MSISTVLNLFFCGIFRDEELLGVYEDICERLVLHSEVISKEDKEVFERFIEKVCKIMNSKSLANAMPSFNSLTDPQPSTSQMLHSDTPVGRGLKPGKRFRHLDVTSEGVLRISYNKNLTMEKPELYMKNSVLAQNDADYVLNKYLSVFQTNNNNIVLDVGCGPGNVTYEKLLPLLPTSTKQIIGVDISNNNIEYARQHYQMDPKVSYEKLDIRTDTIPNKYVEAFDLIVSLYCFHLVGDHKKAFNNIYKMLKPGGKVLISFISKSLIPDMYQYVYDNPKWTKYMSNFKDVVFKPQTDEFTKKLFDEIGFVQVRSEERENTYTYNEEYAYGIIKSLNFFDVPKDLEKEFIENQFEYCENSGYVDVDDNGKKQYHFSHTLFVITAGKS